MGVLKEKSMAALMGGLEHFESHRNSISKTDFTSLKTFMKQYFNTDDKKVRKKIADEFKKRHLELYAFLKDNPELVNAETELSNIITSATNGDIASSEDEKISNIFEIIEEGLK